MSSLIRTAVPNDAEHLVQLRRRLFAETAFVLWEAAEFTATAEDEPHFIERLASRPNSRLLVAASDSAVVGFLAAIGGERNRLRHSVLLALGVAREYWSEVSRPVCCRYCVAASVKLKRLELMVHTAQCQSARALPKAPIRGGRHAQVLATRGRGVRR